MSALKARRAKVRKIRYGLDMSRSNLARLLRAGAMALAHEHHPPLNYRMFVNAYENLKAEAARLDPEGGWRSLDAFMPYPVTVEPGPIRIEPTPA